LWVFLFYNQEIWWLGLIRQPRKEYMVRECVSLLNNIVLQENIKDQWRWLLDLIHGYSVSGTYCFLTDTDDQVAASLLTDVWHKLVPTKVSMFVWSLLQDRISTKSNLVRRHVLQSTDNLCCWLWFIWDDILSIRWMWLGWECLVFSLSVAWCSLCFSRLGNRLFLAVYSLGGITATFSFLS